MNHPSSGGHGEDVSKLSLLKQRMLERKKLRRRTLGGRDGRSHSRPEDGSRPTGYSKQQHKQHRPTITAEATTDHRSNSQYFNDEQPVGPAANTRDRRHLDHDEPRHARNHDEQPVGPAANTRDRRHLDHDEPRHARNHDEQPVGPAANTRDRRHRDHDEPRQPRDHDEQPFGTDENRRDHRHRNHDEQPVRPAANTKDRRHRVHDEQQPVAPAGKRLDVNSENDNRMYDNDQPSPDYDASTKEQSREYVREEDGDDNNIIQNVGQEEGEHQQQRNRLTAPRNANAGKSKADLLMNWDEQPVHQKVSMGPQEDDDSQAEVAQQYCETCDKSFAPPTYKRMCTELGKNGVPRCVKMQKGSTRKKFNSAKSRIMNNSSLNEHDEKIAIAKSKRVAKEMRAQKSGKKKQKKKSSKWKEESKNLREAMKYCREVAAEEAKKQQKA